MKMVSFSVENYRSITHARQIKLYDSTVLIGPNNEGKSNILRALNAAMYAISRSTRASIANSNPRSIFKRKIARAEAYDWSRDFPISMNKPNNKKKTKITIDFKLTDNEIEEFKREVKSDLNGTLPISITFSEHDFDIKVVKRGPGSKSLNSKTTRICRFLYSRIQFQYIPAVRTARQSASIVESIVSNELSAIESDPKFQDAIRAIKELQQPILDSFSKTTTETLRSFLPSVKKVKFSVSDERRYSALSQTIDIHVDDGTITNLEEKGDGVQSLVGLGLRRHILEQERDRRTYIFAIEEPEAHLHPDAIYALRKVLSEISNVDQILVTTHSGILSNRNPIESNIIVNKSKASPARNLSEIRSALGIRSYDNLVNADVILLVEGDDDKCSIGAILSNHSKQLLDAINSGRLIIDSLDGAGSLGAKIGLYRSILCQVHCFIDADVAGKGAIERAKKAGLLTESDYTMTTLAGLKESEFEDLLDKSFYRNILIEHFNVDIDKVKSRKKGKWSEKMSDIFIQCGHIFDDKTKMLAKYRVSEAVVAAPQSAIAPHAESIIQALGNALVRKLDALN